MASTDIPNDIDTIRDLLLGLTAVVTDTNRRVARMEAAFIAAQNEAAHWNRVQIEIAARMGVDMPDVVAHAESNANAAPRTNPEPQSAPSALSDLTQRTGAAMDATGASTPVPPEAPNPFRALIPDNMPQTVSGETVSKPAEIDPDTLNWFVGANDNYYVHGENGEPDRRATAAEIRAINAGSRSDRPRRRKR